MDLILRIRQMKADQMSMGGFLNNSQIEVFIAQLGSCSFLIFLMEFILYMYLKLCVWLDTQETPNGRWASYFIHNAGYKIPRNDVLIVSSLPTN